LQAAPFGKACKGDVQLGGDDDGMSFDPAFAAKVMVRSIASLSIAIQPGYAVGAADADGSTILLHNVFRPVRRLRAVLERELLIARRIVVLTCSCGIFPTGRRPATRRTSRLAQPNEGPTGSDVRIDFI
jgi:hypothetical protein